MNKMKLSINNIINGKRSLYWSLPQIDCCCVYWVCRASEQMVRGLWLQVALWAQLRHIRVQSVLVRYEVHVNDVDGSTVNHFLLTNGVFLEIDVLQLTIFRETR
jgi:hypothetical protein